MSTIVSTHLNTDTDPYLEHYLGTIAQKAAETATQREAARLAKRQAVREEQQRVRDELKVGAKTTAQKEDMARLDRERASAQVGRIVGRLGGW